MSKITDTSKSPHARLDSVGLKDVAVDDSFWRPKQEVNRAASLPHQWGECERTGRVDNFRILAGRKRGEVTKHLAPDSDLYKWAEAASFDLNSAPDTRVRSELEEFVSLVAAAQDETGYIDTSFQLDTSFQPDKDSWWTNLTHGHELYCGGHLIQAAIAHRRATGDSVLLDVAVKWADYVDALFGPGKRPGTGGHPEVEMALVELYRETGERRYLDLAVYFMEMRGRKPPVLNGSPNLQDHLPAREQVTPTGHAVRQLYLASGVTDVYAETGDESLLDTMKNLWGNLTQKKMYLTGGAGARYQGEAFGADYELPNPTAYAETCAAIASVMWSWRMLQVTGEAKYADEVERALYNGILSGMSLDGLTYFYTNGLEHDGGPDVAGTRRGANRRTSAHFDRVPCCPPNLARTVAGLGGCVYGKGRGSEKAIYVHLYVGSRARIELDGNAVEIVQETRYPWDGCVEITVRPSRNLLFALHLRVPGWASSGEIALDGDATIRVVEPGAYAVVSREWKPGDKVTLTLPMPVVRLVSHPRVTCNNNCVALRRGPVVYCIESTDHPGVDLFSMALPDDADIEAKFEEDLLGGGVTLRGEAVLRPGPFSEDTPLYAQLGQTPAEAKRTTFTAIPYYAWANREPGAMRVWIPRA